VCVCVYFCVNLIYNVADLYIYIYMKLNLINWHCFLSLLYLAVVIIIYLEVGTTLEFNSPYSSEEWSL